jgi:BASS family bile acid:Na+ symporter
MIVVRIAVIILQLSVELVVFSLGLEATLADATSLFRRPALLFRSLLSMNVIMPAFAAALAALFALKPEVKIALIFLAVSPVPPVLPVQQFRVSGRSNYIHGLLVSAALISIVAVPLTIDLLGRAFGQDVHISPATVARVVGISVLAPLAAGMLVHRLAPNVTQKVAPILSKMALVLLLASAAVILAVSFPAILTMIGNGTVLAITAFVVMGAAFGHLLGGPVPSERTTLALATASRHPGLALAITAATYPPQRRNVAAVVLLYFLVKAVVLLPYNAQRKRQLAGFNPPEKTAPKRAA